MDVTFFQNFIVRVSLVGNIIFNAAGWIILVLFVRPQQSLVILHYNVYFGVDLIGDWMQAYLIPSIGLLFLAVNTLLARSFYNQKERVAAYVLLLASLMLQIGVVIAVSGIAIVNY